MLAPVTRTPPLLLRESIEPQCPSSHSNCPHAAPAPDGKSALGLNRSLYQHVDRARVQASFGERVVVQIRFADPLSDGTWMCEGTGDGRRTTLCEHLIEVGLA